MQLLFPKSEIATYASRYAPARNEEELIDLRNTVQIAGHVTKSQFTALAKWKSPRSAPRVDRNNDEFIKEITGISLQSNSERTRIEVLTILDGVHWPTASVVLHLFHKEPYPILDFRALWSVSTKVPKQYTFAFWLDYVEFCRDLSNANNIPMRTLDQALWQYSYENQRGSVA